MRSRHCPPRTRRCNGGLPRTSATSAVRASASPPSGSAATTLAAASTSTPAARWCTRRHRGRHETGAGDGQRRCRRLGAVHQGDAGDRPHHAPRLTTRITVPQSVEPCYPPFVWLSKAGDRADGDLGLNEVGETIPVYEARLVLEKRTVERGGGVIDVTVTERDETVEVLLKQHVLIVERIPVGRVVEE